MRKKLACLMICFITMFTCLTGCGLFVLDQDRYLDEVVATAGDIKITKEKLLVMYNNYAETLINSYGFTKKKAVDYCLNNLINNEILVQNSKNKLVLTKEQMTHAVEETVAYFNSLIGTYEEEVRAEWDRVSTKPEHNHEHNDNKYVEYEKKGKLVNKGTEQSPDYKIERIEQKSNIVVNEDYVKVVEDYLGKKKIDLLPIFKKQWVPEFQDVGEEALKRVVISQKSQYNSYKNLKDDEILEKTLFKHFENVVDSIFVSAFEEEYQKTVFDTITINDIMNEYYRLVNEGKAKYDLDKIGYDKYVKDVLENTDKMFYHPVENEFFYVSHVLLEFNEEQKAQIDERKKMLEHGAITKADFEAFRTNLLKQIKVKEIKDHEEENADEKGLTPEQVLMEIQNAVNSEVTEHGKGKAFNKFVYKYNADPGIKNKNRDYVIGTEKGDDVRSKMVETFTKASRDLFDNGNGKIGTISGLVESDYGYHIIMYTGKLQNIDTNLIPIDVCLKLDSTLANLHSDKTIFDEMLENILSKNNKVDDLKMSIVNEYKSTHQVVKYPDRVKELYK